jgi:hypothetical protein
MNNKSIENLIRKKIETTMIGALARFEDGFGDFWGHDSDNPSQEQIRNRMIWDRIRNEILDHGNNQLRKAISELKGQNNFDKVKYSYYYKFNTNKENNK